MMPFESQKGSVRFLQF